MRRRSVVEREEYSEGSIKPMEDHATVTNAQSTPNKQRRQNGGKPVSKSRKGLTHGIFETLRGVGSMGERVHCVAVSEVAVRFTMPAGRPLPNFGRAEPEQDGCDCRGSGRCSWAQAGRIMLSGEQSQLNGVHQAMTERRQNKSSLVVHTAPPMVQPDIWKPILACQTAPSRAKSGTI